MLSLILNEGYHLSNVISAASLEAALTASLTSGILKVILLIGSLFIFKRQFFQGGGITVTQLHSMVSSAFYPHGAQC